MTPHQDTGDNDQTGYNTNCTSAQVSPATRYCSDNPEFHAFKALTLHAYFGRLLHKANSYLNW